MRCSEPGPHVTVAIVVPRAGSLNLGRHPPTKTHIDICILSGYTRSHAMFSRLLVDKSKKPLALSSERWLIAISSAKLVIPAPGPG